MKYNLWILIISISLISCKDSQKEIKSLKSELVQILESDQDLRRIFTPDITPEGKRQILKKYNITAEEFETRGWKITQEIDSLNLIKVEKIISKHGYPGKELVGEKLSAAVWYVIQHSELPTMEKYFPLIEKANKERDLDDRNIAMMKDRMLMYQGKPQIYGTQGAGRLFINPTTQEEEWTNFIWPIENPNNVNDLRKSMNINTTIEEYAESMGIDYSKIYTIEEIENLTIK